MVLRKLDSKRAQVTALLVVIAVMTVLAGGAYLLSSGKLAEITGFETIISSGNNVQECNTTISSLGTYGLDGAGDNGELTCEPGVSAYGVNITATGVTLDCAGLEITGENNFGVRVDTSAAGTVTIKNCIIRGFGTCISLKNFGASTIVNLTDNIFDCSTDISFVLSATSSVKIYNNEFLGGGLSGTYSSADFCESNDGNFYKAGLSIPVTDCGNITDILYVNGTKLNDIDEIYNVSDLIINWSKQSVSAMSATEGYPVYYVDVYDEDTGWAPWSENQPSPSLTDTIGVWGYFDPILFAIKLRSFNGEVNNTAIETTKFTINNDRDDDDALVLSAEDLAQIAIDIPEAGIGVENWDCNDNNASIHRPSNRENFTSTDMNGGNGTTFCYNAVDDDCDSEDVAGEYATLSGGIDWLDYGCGSGFDPGSFDSQLYLNGTIVDITTAKTKSGSNYVLISNEYGKIQYFTATDLTGVNFDDIFMIEHNNLSADSGDGYFSRFDKQANITLWGLDADYETGPEILKDGQPCTPGECFNIRPTNKSKFTNNITFTVSGFSSYSTTTNSRLEIFTQNDTESGTLSTQFPKALETHHRIKFYANYTRFPDGEPLNNVSADGTPGDVYHGATCNITLFDTSGTPILGADAVNMTYDKFYGIYWFEAGNRNFTFPSAFYSYEIGCYSKIYEPLVVSEPLIIIEDVTPPSKPILYEQLLLHPTNWTLQTNTTVAGYFGESDVNYVINILHGTWSYQFTPTPAYTEAHSEYKGENPVVNFEGVQGQNVTFIAWNPEIEEALQSFRWIEFSNHNRTYFKRYYVQESNRTGDDIFILTNDTWEKDIPIGTTIQIFNQPFPAGYFSQIVTLYPGANRIAVWGTDLAELAGNATHDWINAPYSSIAPNKPVLWLIPKAVMSGSDFYVIGYSNETLYNFINHTINFVQGDDFYTNWSTDDLNNPGVEQSLLQAEATVSQTALVGSNYFQILDYDYDRIGAANFTTFWVEFSNHDRTHWFHYNVTNTTDNPGEDARVYIDPPLEAALIVNSTNARFYNSTFRNGWFNVSILGSELVTHNMSNYTAEVYAVPFRNLTEGYKSDSQFVFIDPTRPWFNFTPGYNYSMTKNPVLMFNVSDDFKVDIDTLEITLSNDTGTQLYYTLTNMTWCDDMGDQALYSCGVMFNTTENGTYSINFSVYDVAGWHYNHSASFIVDVNTIDVISVLDEDDITNDLWLYFNWTAAGGGLENYDYALGTAQYPESGYDGVKSWTSTCDAYGCTNASVNLTHESDPSDINYTEVNMRSGTVYYLTVRAKNLAGEYGEYASSDGILFIDPTPPFFMNMTDHGPWTNSNSQLAATWNFEDNESDIIEYQYTIGTARYPASGYNSVVGPILITSNSTTTYTPGLEENMKYYFSVKARNGNVAMNYNGSWSSWHSSGGVQVDTTPPSGGRVYWYNDTDYTTSGYVTVGYDVGTDEYSGASGNVKGLIQIGSSKLTDDDCDTISDIDFVNSSDVLPGGASYRDVNVTSGRCYLFRLYTWDNASNGRTYVAENETLKVIKADTTPPSDIAPVLDDGFYTNSRSSLHAKWTASYDEETGLDYYSWRIIEKPPVGFPGECYVNLTESIGTNCTEEAASGNTTATEISINNLNLTHNHQYFFQVRAWNNAGLNSSTGYSNGIIYIDNAPPHALKIFTVNEDNESSSPFLTEFNNGIINITAFGDFDGYPDIDNCMLLSEDIDYSEDTSIDTVLANCSITRVWSNDSTSPAVNFTEALTNYSPKIITQVNCLNNTNATNPDGNATQETFSWQIACRDPYWNTQNYAQNTLVWFTVDWPEPPAITVSVGNSMHEHSVFSDDDVYCFANMTDPEDNLNTTNITVIWEVGGEEVLTTYTSASWLENTTYSLTEGLFADYTFRTQNVTCRVNASDDRNASSESSATIVINNTIPYGPFYLISPDEETVNGEAIFSWIGPYDDVDNDFMTLEIQFDNETEFNNSNDPQFSFKPTTQMTVGGSPIPGIQRNPDVYLDTIVYEDNRAGNWDIYRYDILTDTETPIATSSPADQYNPKAYDDYVVYEEGDGFTSRVMLYNLNTAVTTEIASSITAYTMDFFSGWIVYHDGGAVVMSSIWNTSHEKIIYTTGTATGVQVFGNHTVWTDASDDIWIYDAGNNSVRYTGLKGEAQLFGHLLVNEYAGTINVTNLMNGTVFELSGYNASISGGRLIYVDPSGPTINATDLLSHNLSTISIGPGTSPAFHAGVLAFENASDIYYTEQKLQARSRIMIESLLAPSIYVKLNTTLSPDDGYVWRVRGCDSAFENNSCIWATSLITGEKYATFTIDNTAPAITSLSPAHNSIVAGQFRAYANIVDNLGPDAVVYANYSMTYTDNNTIRASGDMSRVGTVWKSDMLDFLDINRSNFTLTVTASDYMENIGSASVNFTINNDTSWFLFGTGADELIENASIISTVINSDFIAYTVLTSKIKIVGPLPANTTRYTQSKTNLTIVNHNYSDPISTLTWPDGTYRAEFTATNLDGSTGANRTFIVDNNRPRWYNNTRTPNGTVFATDSLTVSINWTDYTLREVNISYNNTNISNSTPMNKVNNGTISSGIFSSAPLSVSAYINKTFSWWSSARDGLNRTNLTSTTGFFNVFVESNPPTFTGTIPNITVNEDSYTTSLPDLNASYFSDPDVVGVWGYLDNLTYAATYDATNMTITLNATSGKITNLSVSNDFYGNLTVVFNATDYYGKANYSNTVTVIVAPVNDAPEIKNLSTGLPMPDVDITEDDFTPIEINLSEYEYDLDGDSVTWISITIWDETKVNKSWDVANKMVNFTVLPDAWGKVNVTFRLQDSGSPTIITEHNMTINITGVNDVPVIGTITAPIAGSANKGNITVTWTDATDIANENQDLIHELSYSTTGSAPWIVIDDYSVIQKNTTYVWQSENDITSKTVVYLRLNVSDGIDTDEYIHGWITVDNEKPIVLINWPIWPSGVVVGSSFDADVDTINSTGDPKITNCTFYLNGNYAAFSDTVSSHVESITGYIYNTTYNLSISCVDLTQNIGTNWTLVEPRETALEFIRAYVSPSLAYAGQSVNLTIEVAANNTIAPGNFDVNLVSSSGTQSFILNDFTFVSGGIYQVIALDGDTPADTLSLGKYNITIVDMETEDGISMTSLPILVVDVLEVFPAVNQTLNLE
ncbi:MAG: Ig-like domain-containing protein [Candidatus Woesearchaeota archaeon]